MADSPQDQSLDVASSELEKLAPEPHLTARAKRKLMTALKLRRAVNKSAGICTTANPKRSYRPKRKFNLSEARTLCEILSTSVNSLIGVCREHPELPPYDSIDHWKHRNPKFAEMLSKARERQAEYIAQTCLDLAQTANKDNAHAVRIKFDIARWYASKLLPAVYGDKPADVKVSTTVQVAISPQRLEDIRSRLESSRTIYLQDQSKRATGQPRALENTNNGQSKHES